ncbi:IS3 family transposase, partial [Pelagicoccus sp. SDUM812002]|uniref:IS3 family transposase n=1 Tax=Pelagicoccus sp. SDUM812002 TaxID=3041266 RepID=UPI00280CD15E
MKAIADELSARHSVSLVCTTIGLSRSTRYHTVGSGSRHALDSDLKREVARVHRENKRIYGAPRIRLALREQGLCHSKRRIARLMRELDIKGRSRGRSNAPCVTDSKHKNRISPNKLGELEEVKKAHSVWVSDTTDLKGRDQWLYLAVTMDYYSRTIVGWEVSPVNDACLTSKALSNAIAAYPTTRPLHHSDRGSTYTAKAYMETLEKVDAISSMSRK